MLLGVSHRGEQFFLIPSSRSIKTKLSNSFQDIWTVIALSDLEGFELRSRSRGIGQCQLH